jgi:hypothetical protein
MRRRVVGVKKLPSKKSKTLEVPQTSNYLHVKLVLGWGFIVFFDAIIGFRLEYLYPAFMFLRSVIDSYKYQGLVFSLFFILLVLYLDMVCWTLLVGPWLFLIASSFVWLELIRNWDNSFGYASIFIWVFFLYIEISQRLSFLPPSIVTFLRPFGAHCIGYPVVAMSFQLKHQLTHVIRQRQQKHVSEENLRCFDIMCKALPLDEDDSSEDGTKLSLYMDEQGGTTTTNEHKTKNNINRHLSKNGLTNGKGVGLNNSKVQSLKSSSNGHNHKTISVGGAGSSKKDSTLPNKILDNKIVANGNGRMSPLLWKQGYSAEVPLVPNGTIENQLIESLMVEDINHHPPPSTGKVNLPVSQKKHALVKAVPRTDLQQQAEAREKACKSSEVLAMELKDERHQRSQLENEVLKFEKEVKRLQAEVHASSLQEEEANQRVIILVHQERSLRSEIQRLKTEVDSLQNRLSKLSSKNSHDVDSIATLEEQLKQEILTREKLEGQLREHRTQASTLNQWSKEEMKEMKDKLIKKEKELIACQNEQQMTHKKCQSLNATLIEKSKEFNIMDGKINQLKESLADETRVKIDLFQHLSDARRKQECLVDEIKLKEKEIEALHLKLQQMVALQSTWTPSLSPPH